MRHGVAKLAAMDDAAAAHYRKQSGSSPALAQENEHRVSPLAAQNLAEKVREKQTTVLLFLTNWGNISCNLCNFFNRIECFTLKRDKDGFYTHLHNIFLKPKTTDI